MAIATAVEFATSGPCEAFNVIDDSNVIALIKFRRLHRSCGHSGRHIIQIIQFKLHIRRSITDSVPLI